MFSGQKSLDCSDCYGRTSHSHIACLTQRPGVSRTQWLEDGLTNLITNVVRGGGAAHCAVLVVALHYIHHHLAQLHSERGRGGQLVIAIMWVDGKVTFRGMHRTDSSGDHAAPDETQMRVEMAKARAQG